MKTLMVAIRQNKPFKIFGLSKKVSPKKRKTIKGNFCRVTFINLDVEV